MADYSIVRSTVLRAYLLNPGKLYNSGNYLAISAAVVQQILLTEAVFSQSLNGIAGAFFGSAPALCTSIATLTFFIGGNHYTKAWAKGFPAIESHNRAGHLWSALGALLLGVGLAGFAQSNFALAMCLISTALHVGGKFGSALNPTNDAAFKPLPLFSRLPYAASLCADVYAQFSIPQSTAMLLTNITLPASLVFCAILWATADCELMPPAKWKTNVKTFMGFS